MYEIGREEGRLRQKRKGTLIDHSIIIAICHFGANWLLWEIDAFPEMRSDAILILSIFIGIIFANSSNIIDS
jgi:hypothetical protein